METDYDAIQDEHEHQQRHRMQQMMKIAKPWDSIPECYCTECKGFTTNYNSRGECREHGIAVTEDIIQTEEERLRVSALLHGDMDTLEDEPHHYLAGIVDISEQEDEK